MKKEYTAPIIRFHQILAKQMLCLSIDVDNEESDNDDSGKSRAYERNSMLWEEDE